MLNISDGTNSAAIHFIGSYQQANFNFVSDGQNGTIVFDPPVPANTPAGSTGTGPVAGADGFNFAASSVVTSAGSTDAGDTHGGAGGSLNQVLNMHVDASAPPSGQILDAVIADNKLLPGHDYHVL